METGSLKDDATGNDRRWVSHMSLVFLRYSVIGLASGMEVQALFNLTIALPSY